ncbi:MAG: ABC-type Zn uptake system ZnuABC Zn-binding protein ZnuA/ABC-type Mn2+ [Sphingobacteriales bacterium]|jgi:ABC-type Zn uptake system ZnuABC Zn-binding protein ZnuA/ABC-type Mn2+/Zn2+ transport system ATPase subunit
MRLVNTVICTFFFLSILAQKPKVVTSTTMITDFCKELGGDKIDLIGIVPVGSDPHLYDPVPQDAENISKADLIVKNGLKLEGWIGKLIKNAAQNALIIEASDGVKAIESDQFNGSPDPHAWMDVQNAIIYSENITAAFIKVDPTNEEFYKNRLKNYSEKLIDLHAETYAAIQSIPLKQRVLITTHDAFEYFSKAYNIRVESALGISTEAEVQIGDIKDLTELILEGDIPAIFVETTINPKLFLQMAKDLKIKIGGSLYSDSLGDEESGADTYLKMIRYNTKLIVNALSGNSVPKKNEDKNEIGLSFILTITILLGAAFAIVALNVRTKKTQDTHLDGAAIKIEGLTVSYDRKTVLDNVYLEVEAGKMYGIIGPNGAGKTSLYKTILNLITPDSGTISVKNNNHLTTSQQIAYIPQKEDIDWEFPATVEEIVSMGRYPFKKTFEGVSKLDKQKTLDAMRLLDIEDLRNRQIGELSGGQQQRIFIARALAQDAEIYLMDEPFVGVDIKTEQKIIDILKKICADGKTVLVIHHDLSKVEEYFTHVILLNRFLVAHGKTTEVFTPENIKKTYTSQQVIQMEMDQIMYTS